MNVHDYLYQVCGDTQVRIDFRCGSADVSVETNVSRVFDEGSPLKQFHQMAISSVNVERDVLVLQLDDTRKEVKL